MPQMSPLQWELLFIFSLLSAVMMSCKIFFMDFNKNSGMTSTKENQNKMFTNWLW